MIRTIKASRRERLHRRFFSTVAGEKWKEKSDDLYRKLLSDPQEKLLPVEDIQGDVILGFNKPLSLHLVFDLFDEKEISAKAFKSWMLNTMMPRISSTKDVKTIRNDRHTTNSNEDGKVLTNISFGYNCINILLANSPNSSSLQRFKPTSAFVIGAKDRRYLLGDGSVENKFEFGGSKNNDILINLGSDSLEAITTLKNKILEETKSFLSLANETTAYRGDQENDALYGHENFGFLDGLSQPEVRGKYLMDDRHTQDFIVRRRLVASEEDQRYLDYARPGFKLLDVGHFLLGHLENFPDTREPGMENPDPTKYRKLVEQYPDWCTNGSFVVYRKIQQDVPGFWACMLQNANKLSDREDWGLDDTGLKNLAGDLAAKAVGRWWDGTPLSFGSPITKMHYPPPPYPQSAGLKEREGLLNGFAFDAEQPAWEVLTSEGGKKTVVPKGKKVFAKDGDGRSCPFGGHIRKVNPRDEFTDIGGDTQTNKHRIIRRGNNYSDQLNGDLKSVKEAIKEHKTRVKDVFSPTKEEKKSRRGLALVMYQAQIEDQFEFLQRHWSNSGSRPRAPGNDLIIGRDPAATDGGKSQSILISDISGRPPLSAPFELDAGGFFTEPVGMGYFLLPSKSAIKEVLCGAPSQAEKLYQLPGNNRDVEGVAFQAAWSKVVERNFWSCIWGLALTDDADSEDGIAYRLPDPEKIRDGYRPPSKEIPTYLQFRSTHDLEALAVESGQALATAVIAWQAFPKRILNLFSDSNVNPYEYVERRGWPSKDVTYRKYPSQPLARQMDEYCEWFTHRNKDNKITKIDITAESPEYWGFLFKEAPQTAVELYRKFVSKDVKMSDLMEKDTGNYNPYNKWNTTHGAMHLQCPPNSLFAEIYIAAEASVRWITDDKSWRPKVTGADVATNGNDLIQSGQYGLPTRASDPTIGANVNALIRANKIISIAEPVGLYLQDLDTTGWLDPHGEPFSGEQIQKIVQYVRTNPPEDKLRRNLRIEIKIPDGWGYSLGDCSIGGAPIEWAGQVIDASVTVFLTGVAIDGLGKEPLLHDDVAEKAIVRSKNVWALGPQYPLDLKPLVPEPK